MNAYTVLVPSRWRAGHEGAREVYFDCAGCGAKAPEIAGFWGEDARLGAIAVVTDAGGRSAPAMYCAACWEKAESGVATEGI